MNNLFDIIAKYEKATGAKLNKTKTEAIWLGRWRHRLDTPLNLKWVSKMRILGGFFGHGNLEKENWSPNLGKLEKVLSFWNSRALSFIGRALVINVLAASLFWHLAKTFAVPRWVETSFDRLVWSFLWQGRAETVKRKILINEIQNGGLKNVHLRSKYKPYLDEYCTTIKSN